MTDMPAWQQAALIAICAAATMMTRFLPFFIFTPNKPLPLCVRYLGKALPAAIFALLVVYCLRHVSLISGNHGIPEAIGLAVTVALHLWKRQMLLSMAAGTLCYMGLVQYVFI